MKCDGVMGLSPGDLEVEKNKKGLFDMKKNKRDGFIENLHDQGKIKERVFSFFLTDYDDYKKVPMFTVGGYDIDKFAPNQTITWNYLTEFTYWTVKLTNVYLGE